MQQVLTALDGSERLRRRGLELERPIASALSLDHVHADVIEQSYQRCATIGLSRTQSPEFAPMGRSDLGHARERNRRLYTHAAPVMEMLYEQIVNTQSMVILTDVCGTIIHSTGDDDFLARASKVALQAGVNWSESSKGTNAIGTALVSETPTLVHADEHFMHANHFLTCSASPIFDPRGSILGVLDVSGDHRRFHQHTMGLVKMSARMIENHWLSEDFRHVMRLHLHTRVECLGTLMEGILAVSRDGRILGANRSALDHLGLSGAAARMHSVTSLFGTTVGALVDHFRSPLASPLPLHLPGGTLCHVQARFDWGTWFGSREEGDAAGSRPPPAEAGPVKATDAPSAPVAEPLPVDPPAPLEARQAPASPAALAPVAAGSPAAPFVAPGAARTALDALDTGDERLRAVIAKARKALDRDLPLLILGETGTGKEMLARAFHDDSRRAAQPFVAVNCASIPESLIEAELFGYEDGAFTGARRRGAAGKLLQAHGGTLFLDEIGDMPLALQARLLRVLQERRVTPLGSAKSIPVDVTLIAATHCNLRQMIEAKAFREDLYYRLNSLVLRLPALRERSDLGALVRSILAAQGGTPPRLAPRVVQRLHAHRWPGNVRELANVLRTACVMATGEPLIDCSHLSDEFIVDTDPLLDAVVPGEGGVAAGMAGLGLAGSAFAAAPGATALGPLGSEPPPPTVAETPRTLEEREIEMIRQALDAHAGNISAAAKQLGISRNTIYRRLYWSSAAS